MATFRKRAGRWQARVINKGQTTATKTFDSKNDAERWARAIQREIDLGAYAPVAKSPPMRPVLNSPHQVVNKLEMACAYYSAADIGCTWPSIESDWQTNSHQRVVPDSGVVVHSHM